MSNTIAAIATPIGEGGLSVIRLSGSSATIIARKIFRTPTGNTVNSFLSNKVYFGSIQDPETGEYIDQVILTSFQAPKSYTGEDIIEISAHGGVFVSSRILQLVLHQGARPADPGEFTRRAFINGRIDLSQAEAVADVISAASDKALQSAITQLKGHLSRQVNELYDRLLSVLSHIEAIIDFPEEGLDFQNRKILIDEVRKVLNEVNILISSYRQGKIFREGASVALIGKPNVGKSSLLNALLQEDRAIVNPHPGTTRDTLEERVRIKDTHINIIDSAGLMNSPETVEKEGMQRTRLAIGQADLILVIFDRSQPLDENDDLIYKEVGEKPKLIVINKCDLPEVWSVENLKFQSNNHIFISAKEQSGFQTLINSIHNHLSGKAISTETIYITRERHRSLLFDSAKSLKKVLESFEKNLSEEFVATDLSLAMGHLAAIIGKSIEDDLLDQIFNSFCIGK